MFFPQPRPKKSSENEHEAIFLPTFDSENPKTLFALKGMCSSQMPCPYQRMHGKPAQSQHCSTAPLKCTWRCCRTGKKKNRPALWLRQLLADWTCVSRTQMTNKTRAVWFLMQIKEKCKYYEHILIKRQKGKAVWWNSAGILDTMNILCCKKCKMQSMQIFFLYRQAVHTATGKECTVRYRWSLQCELSTNIQHIFCGSGFDWSHAVVTNYNSVNHTLNSGQR